MNQSGDKQSHQHGMQNADSQPQHPEETINRLQNIIRDLKLEIDGLKLEISDLKNQVNKKSHKIYLRTGSKPHTQTLNSWSESMETQFAFMVIDGSAFTPDADQSSLKLQIENIVSKFNSSKNNDDVEDDNHVNLFNRWRNLGAKYNGTYPKGYSYNGIINEYHSCLKLNNDRYLKDCLSEALFNFQKGREWSLTMGNKTEKLSLKDNGKIDEISTVFKLVSLDKEVKKPGINLNQFLEGKFDPFTLPKSLSQKAVRVKDATPIIQSKNTGENIFRNQLTKSQHTEVTRSRIPIVNNINRVLDVPKLIDPDLEYYSIMRKNLSKSSYLLPNSKFLNSQKEIHDLKNSLEQQGMKVFVFISPIDELLQKIESKDKVEGVNIYEEAKNPMYRFLTKTDYIHTLNISNAIASIVKGVKSIDPKIAEMGRQKRSENADEYAKRIRILINDIKREENVSSYRDTVEVLNRRSIKTYRGGKWHIKTLQDLNKRWEEMSL